MEEDVEVIVIHFHLKCSMTRTTRKTTFQEAIRNIF